MIEAFIRHIQEKSLVGPEKRYLLACSGGLDSMCLAHLLEKSGVSFDIAHVNFQLRGAESDQDELFIKDFAARKSIPFHLKRVQTKNYVESHKVSVQEAARDLRYTFFEQILAQQNLAAVLVAHHQDDQIETIFLNLLRGTGIEGISGMSDQRGQIIRPLLPFSREEIEDFARLEGLSWREDSSNEKTDYLRNKLRHQMLPHLLDLKADARQNLLASFDRIRDTGRAFASLFEEWTLRYCQEQDDIFSLEIQALKQYSGSQSLLFYWLRQFGFNSDQSKSIHQAAILGNSGKIFESREYLANVDREDILVCKKETEFTPIELGISDIELNLGNDSYSILHSQPGDFIDKNSSNAMLDFDLLSFPLEIRTWQLGDRFNPLGMSQEKKVSDFLIDLKIPFIKKAQVKVVLSAGKIAWIIGHRIADWVKTTAGTRKIFYLKKN